MRTIKVNLYPISELPAPAKAKALEYMRERHEWHWHREYMASLGAFLGLFGVSVSDYSLDVFGACVVKTDVDEVELPASVSVPAVDSCGLTGFCADYDILEGYHKALGQHPGDMHYAICEAIGAFIRSYKSEMLGQLEDGYQIEHADANGYEFTEDGTRFTGRG